QHHGSTWTVGEEGQAAPMVSALPLEEADGLEGGIRGSRESYACRTGRRFLRRGGGEMSGKGSPRMGMKSRIRSRSGKVPPPSLCCVEAVGPCSLESSDQHDCQSPPYSWRVLASILQR